MFISVQYDGQKEHRELQGTNDYEEKKKRDVCIEVSSDAGM